MTRLGLSPADFWALSLTEWRWLVASLANSAGEPMDLETLHQLIKQYPD